MSNFKKDVFVFVAKDRKEYKNYQIDGGWGSDSSSLKSKTSDEFCVFVTLLPGSGSIRAKIAEAPENYSAPDKIGAFLDKVFGQLANNIGRNYRCLFICTHWGGGEGTSDEVEVKQVAMQAAYDGADDLKKKYPRCVFISLSEGCTPPKPQGFFTADKITIPADWNKLANKLLPENAYLPPSKDGSGPSFPAAAVSPSHKTRYERLLNECQELFPKLEALAILCQAIDSAIKAKVVVEGKLRTKGPEGAEARRWWQCGDSEITALFSQSEPESKPTVKGIEVPEILVQLRDALTGQCNFPENFDFAASSTALLEIKPKLLAQIDQEA